MIKVIPILLLLAGCATTTVTRPGTDATQTARDIQECQYEGDRAAPMNAIIARQLTVQCLKLRGYNLT